MIDFLNNTLEIITSLTNSAAGYLLKLNLDGKTAISTYGKITDNIEPFNELLFSKFISGQKKQIMPSGNPNLKKKKEGFRYKSYFIDELYFSKTNYNAVWLVLLATKENNFSTECLLKITDILTILSNKIKKNKKELFNNIKEKENCLSCNEYLNKYSQYFPEILFETSEDLFFLLDQNGCFLALNEIGASSIDYKANELIGLHFLELVASKNKLLTSKAFQKIIDNIEPQTFETSLISKYGREVIFEVTAKAIFENQKIIQVLGVARNITELRIFEDKIKDLNTKLIESERIISIEQQRSKKQKAMLYELNKMKSEFLSNVSHELRTPLASIIGFSETIVSDPDMPAETKEEFNNIILNEGKRLAKLINDILDVAKIESGIVKLNFEEVNIVEVIKEAIESNKKIIEQKEIIFTCEIPSENIILKLDKEFIFKALFNVINNAAKFTGAKGRINITAQSLYKEFEIMISDTGIGIPQSDLPNIFQRFYRVNRSGTEISGTGLGLVFAKQIVDLHKGFITVQSEINKGTTVIIKLPRESRT